MLRIHSVKISGVVRRTRP